MAVLCGIPTIQYLARSTHVDRLLKIALHGSEFLEVTNVTSLEVAWYSGRTLLWGLGMADFSCPTLDWQLTDDHLCG